MAGTGGVGTTSLPLLHEVTDASFSTLFDEVSYLAGLFNTSSTGVVDGSFDMGAYNESADATAAAYNLTADVNGTLANETGEDLLYDPTYYSLNYKVIGALFHIIIFVVGVLGNVMIVVVVRTTKFMHSTTNCYLVSLAIADCMVLVSAIPNEVIGYFLLVNQWIWGRAGCALFVFFQYLGINASSLSITAFTVERYIAICHPMKAQSVCTMSRAKRIIIGVWVFAVCYCSPWLALTTTVPVPYKMHDVEQCTFSLSRSKYLAFYMADFILFYVIPLLMSIVMYGLIGRILFKSDSMSKRPGGRSMGPALDRKSGGNKGKVQVIKMLAVVVGMFAVLWMPYRFLVVYNSFASERYLDFWYLMFCKTMVFINSAINPILYNAMSIKFRRAFKRLLSCGSEQHDRRYMYSEVDTNSAMLSASSAGATRQQRLALAAASDTAAAASNQTTPKPSRYRAISNSPAKSSDANSSCSATGTGTGPGTESRANGIPSKATPVTSVDVDVESSQERAQLPITPATNYLTVTGVTVDASCAHLDADQETSYL